MSRPRLYGFWRSSASYRVRIALGLKGVPFDTVPVHLTRGGGEQFASEFCAVNPQSRVPALEVDGAVLTQSMAILEWLEEACPEPPLLPREPFARAHVRALAQLLISDVQPLQNTAVTAWLRREKRWTEEEVGEWLREWIGRGLRAFEELLVRSDFDGRFCCGRTPTLADACLIPQCYSSRRFGVDPSGFPRIAAVERHCRGIEAFRAAAPENQPDREP